MADDKHKVTGSYSVGGRNVPHRVTKVPQRDQAGVPHPIDDQTTPVQPIVINVPSNNGGKKSSSGLEVWYLVVAVVIAVIVSGSISLYIASALMQEQKLKMEKLDEQVEQLDQQQRQLDSRLTKIEAQREQER